MRASTLQVVVGDVTYHVDDPKLSDGLKVSISAIAEEPSDDGPISRILHRDRINLDRSKDREKFAQTAGTEPDDLIEVCDRIRDFLTPASPLNEEPTAEVDAAVREEALALLDSSDLLDRVGTTIRAMGFAGDLTQPILIFLVIVSRLLARPMNLVVGGPSSAGKSFVVALVARLFPASATYSLTGMSEKLLAYTDADLRHRTLIIGEAAALHHDGIGASLLRSLAWEGHIAYETVESTPEGLKPRRIEKEGPTGFVTTTTKGVEAELETRVLTITVPDDEKATRAIMLATAERANGRCPDDPDPRPWHEAQRWLAEEGDHEVTIPYSENLARRYPSTQIRSRRDFTQLLTLIRASAILHQRQRQRDGAGHIIATETDYRIIFELGAPVFGAIAAEGVTPAVRETVKKVGDLTKDTEGATVSVAQLAGALHIDKSSVSRRVKVALRGDFLVNEEMGKGKRFKLRLGDSLPEERAALPPPEDVFGLVGDNTATLQHLDQEPRQDAVIDCCTDDEESLQHGYGFPPGVDNTARLLHGPTQQASPQHDVENRPSTGDCCSVADNGGQTDQGYALGGSTSAQASVNATPPPSRRNAGTAQQGVSVPPDDLPIEEPLAPWDRPTDGEQDHRADCKPLPQVPALQAQIVMASAVEAPAFDRETYDALWARWNALEAQENSS